MNNNSIRHALYFGLVIGALFIVHFLLGISGNLLLTALLQFVIILGVPVLAVYFAIDCRKRVNDNIFTYWQAFRYMMQLFIGAALVSSTFVLVYVQWIDTDFFVTLTERTFEQMEKLQELFSSFSIDEEDIELAIESSYNTRTFVMSHFTGNVFIGLFISLIGAFIARNTKRE